MKAMASSFGILNVTASPETEKFLELVHHHQQVLALRQSS